MSPGHGHGLDDLTAAHAETHEAWEVNAAFWDDRIGEGNDFVNHLIWPATARMMGDVDGQRVLDAACGNGLYARRLARLGAEVVAFDFSEGLIERARARAEEEQSIAYHVLDATDEAALLGLGPGSFDAVICQMALFDISDIRPLLRAVAQLLKPGGYLLYSMMHPCFNSPNTTRTAEQADVAGEIVTTYAMKVYGYLSTVARRGAAIRGQPKPQVYFHRSLETLLGQCFEAGFVVDALEEPAFPPDHDPTNHDLSWRGNFSAIPPVMMVRLRLA